MEGYDIYILTDQPTTCGLCGTRSTYIELMTLNREYYELHKCIDAACSYEFVCVEK